MNIRRVFIIGFGIVAAGVGLSLVFGLARASGLETNTAIVWVLGLLALALGINAIRGRFAADTTFLTTPEPERRYLLPAPGDGFDRRLAGLSVGGRRPDEANWAAVRDRLEETTLSVLTRYGEHTTDDAREQLNHGTWTNDSRAASFFSDEIQPETSVWRRFRDALSSYPAEKRRAQHVVAAFSRLFDNDWKDFEDWQSSGETRSIRSTSPSAASERDEDEFPSWPRPGETLDRRTGRWRGVSAFALLAAGTGMLAHQPALLLIGVVGLVFTTYVHTVTPPAVELELDRTVSDDQPAPDETVEVTVTVRNAGETTLFDLSVIDGVPPRLVVTEGAPRLTTALRPGKTATFSYSVEATSGKHRFEPALVIARDPSGATERATRRDRETTLACDQPADTTASMPLRAQTTRYTGRVPTQTGGSGVEFHATREYQHNDPLSRIDWNRWAKTGELATTEFREERAAAVVLVIDARREAYRAPAHDAPSAVTRSVEAAGAMFTSLLDDANRVGITALAPEPCWLAPGAGAAHRARARTLLADHSALSARPPDDSEAESIHPPHAFPTDAQVIVFSPLCDDAVTEFVRRLDADGHLVTVISPDPTDGGTPGRRLARIERTLRLSGLRRAEIPVLDWETNESLASAVSHLRQRRSL